MLIILCLIYINFYYFNSQEKFEDLSTEINIDDLNSIEGIWTNQEKTLELTIKKNCNKTEKECRLLLKEQSKNIYLKFEEKGIIDDAFFNKIYETTQAQSTKYDNYKGKIYYKLEILIDENDLDFENLEPEHILIILNNDNTLNIKGLRNGIYNVQVLEEAKNLFNAGCDTFIPRGESIGMCNNICKSRGCNDDNFCENECKYCADTINCQWLTDQDISTINKPILKGDYDENNYRIKLEWSFSFEETNIDENENINNTYIINYFIKHDPSSIKNYTKKSSDCTKQNNMIVEFIEMKNNSLDLEQNKSYTFFIVPTNGKSVGLQSNEITIKLGRSNVLSYDQMPTDKPELIGNDDYDDINFELNKKERNILNLKKNNKCEEIIKQDTHYITKPSLLSSLKGKNLEISL